MTQKPEGWQNKKPDDSFRHSQAAKGIKTRSALRLIRATKFAHAISLAERGHMKAADSYLSSVAWHLNRRATLLDTMEHADKLAQIRRAREAILEVTAPIDWHPEDTSAIRALGKDFWVSPVEDMERELKAGKRKKEEIINDYFALAEDALDGMKFAMTDPLAKKYDVVTEQDIKRMIRIVIELRRMEAEAEIRSRFAEGR